MAIAPNSGGTLRSRFQVKIDVAKVFRQCCLRIIAASCRGALDSIWFVAGDRGCCRFDLCGNLLEVLQELSSRTVGEGDTPNHHSLHVRRLIPDGLLWTETRESYDEIAMSECNSGHIARKNLPFVQRVFQR